MQGDHKRRRTKRALVFARGEPGERDREQRPPHAVAYGVDLLGTRDVPYDLGRGERSLRHVVLELRVLHRGVRVLPGDHEHRVALVNQVLDEAVLGLQIEDVVLVDPGRYEHHWHLTNLVRGRLVLDQLY